MFVISFVGDSGVGKTTLLASVIAELSRAGVRVAAVKHSKEFADPDPPAKDSARLRAAGAARVVLSSPARTAVFWDHANREPEFAECLALAGDADVVLVESFHSAGVPAVEVLRAALPRRTLRLEGDSRLRAIVSDFEPGGAPPHIPRFSLEDAGAVARWIRSQLPQ